MEKVWKNLQKVIQKGGKNEEKTLKKTMWKNSWKTSARPSQPRVTRESHKHIQIRRHRQVPRRC